MCVRYTHKKPASNASHVRHILTSMYAVTTIAACVTFLHYVLMVVLYECVCMCVFLTRYSYVCMALNARRTSMADYMCVC